MPFIKIKQKQIFNHLSNLGHATIGAGTITPRDTSKGFDLDALIRDKDNIQRIVKDKELRIETPSINPTRGPALPNRASAFCDIMRMKRLSLKSAFD
ncbi:MAG: hypothetical protein AAF429_12335 [Pseudomonadota bacterium]